MPDKNRKTRFRPALTVVEMVLAMAIMAIFFATLLPQFGAVRNSWDTQAANAEALQNGRVLIDHIRRNLSAAVKITGVSDSSVSNGYIEFEDNDASSLRYGVNSTTDYVEFGSTGGLTDLAGPVSQLRFSCYDSEDFDTPTTDVNSIRFVRVQTTLTNPVALGQDKTFTTSVYLWTNGNSVGGGSEIINGLVAWWKFDETSGSDAADSSGNSNNATLEYGAKFRNGKLGGAVRFDGSDDAVYAGTFDVTGGDGHITMAAWTKVDDFDVSDARIISKAYGTANEDHYWMLSTISSSGIKLRFRLKTDGSTTTFIPSSGNLSIDTWTHVAATWNGSTMILYKDGSPVGGTSKGGTLNTDGSTGVAVGNQPAGAGNKPFDGKIDDVRIYNRGLSSSEIATLAGVVITGRGLVAHWKFDESSGTDAADSSGNNNDGILEDNAQFETGILNNAVEFDGSDSRVSAGTFDVTEGDGHITIAAWIKADDFGTSDGRIVSKATGIYTNDHYWMLSTVSSGGIKLRFRLKTDVGTTTFIPSSGNLSSDTWTHVAATWDGSDIILYKDGTPVDSTYYGGTLSTNGSVGVAVGNQPSDAGSKPFDGLIDDVRIYNCALTSEQIDTLCNFGEPDVGGAGGEGEQMLP